MPDEVDRSDREVLAVRAQVAGIRLRVPGDPVQHQQCRLRRVAWLHETWARSDQTLVKGRWTIHARRAETADFRCLPNR